MLKFNLGKIKPVSVNNAYYMRNKKYNVKARSYRTAFFDSLLLDSNQKYMESIRNGFDKSKHYLSISFNFKLPKAELLTKQGYISRKSMDIDNLLKLPCDFLCNFKYLENPDYPCSNLGIDDQFIGTIQASKTLSIDNNYYLYITIEVLPLENLLIL